MEADMKPHSLWVLPLVASLLGCASSRPPSAPVANGLCVNHNYEGPCESRLEDGDAGGDGSKVLQAEKHRAARESKSRTVTVTSAHVAPRPPAISRPPVPRPPPK
jgi:hypothetical protein